MEEEKQEATTENQETTTENQQTKKEGIFREKSLGQVDDDYYGDDMKLKQVLFNILGNAVRSSQTC